jgi:hypothetical protein
LQVRKCWRRMFLFGLCSTIFKQSRKQKMGAMFIDCKGWAHEKCTSHPKFAQ